MLLRLLRTHLAPYRTWIAIIVALQFVSTVAMLYLPSLNADIIDDGVARGDIGFIIRTGGIMLAVSIVPIAFSVTAVWFSAPTDLAFRRDPRAAVLPRKTGGLGKSV